MSDETLVKFGSPTLAGLTVGAAEGLEQETGAQRSEADSSEMEQEARPSLFVQA